MSWHDCRLLAFQFVSFHREVASSKANPANATTDGVPDKVVRYVRLATRCYEEVHFCFLRSISLQRPHPRYGRLKTKFIYGIRDIQVQTNRLQTIVQDRVTVRKYTL